VSARVVNIRSLLREVGGYLGTPSPERATWLARDGVIECRFCTPHCFDKGKLKAVYYIAKCYGLEVIDWSVCPFTERYALVVLTLAFEGDRRGGGGA